MSEGGKSEDSLVNMLKNMNFDLKENVLTNCPPPSLEFIALSKIAITLWKVQLEKSGNYCLHSGCPDEMEIFNNIPNLMIPKLCKEDLTQMVKLIRREMSVDNNFLREKLKKIKLRIFFNNLFWNTQGTINYLKTAQKIIEDTNLSTLEKYDLACHFCLKGKILDLQNHLSKEDIKYLGKIKTPSMTTFWPLYIKNDEKLPLFIDGVPALDYLHRCIIKCQSEAAIQYIWENFADDTLKERITSIVPSIHWYTSCSVLYFFPQMSHSQLKEISNYHINNTLLSKLYFFSKWNNKDVPLPKYASAVMKIEKNMYSAFRVVQFCWNYVFSDLEDCMSIWNVFVTCFKVELETKDLITYAYVEFLHLVGDAYKQGLFTKLLLNFANSEVRKTLLYSRKTILNCKRLLCEEEDGEALLDDLSKKDGLQSFDIFIKLILKENEILEFKKKFFQVEKMKICYKLVFDQNYELLDKILAKFHIEEINEFKKKYCINILGSLLKEAKGKPVEILPVVVSFLGWCLDDKKEIMRYSNLVSDLEFTIYYRRTKLIIMWGKWVLVRKYWKFILCTKKREKTNSTENSLAYMRKKNCQDLKRVITSCFDKDEVEELLVELQKNDGLLFEVKELIELKHLPEVDGFLSWCFSSDESRICDFKTTFMDQFGCSLLFQFIEYDDIEEVKSILSWFNPSVKLAKGFRVKFNNFISNIRNMKVNSSSRDVEVRRAKENNKNILNERIRKSLDLINLYIKKNCELGKVNNTAKRHSKKRKITERKEPIKKNKKRKKSI